jgi:FixJ family two-component response regulator
MKQALSNQPGDSVVLVIDDDPTFRTIIETLLESVGLQTRTYASVQEFSDSKIPEQTSCLILDVRLPGSSGFDLQAELNKANINIPIIFVSGFGDVRMSVKAMKAGAFEFLSKPFRDEDLLDAVRAALKHDHMRREHEDTFHDLQRRYNTLSAREQEVMIHIVAGLKNKQVAAEIGLAEVTVKVHRHTLMKKLGARHFASLVRMADLLKLSYSQNT